MFKKLAAASILAALGVAQAQTIDSITLFNSQNPGQIWITSSPSAHWILGVSDQASGPLLNASNASVSGISQGNYWLFADPANLGVLPQLTVTFSDGSTLNAIFSVSGTNGTATSWTRVSGSDKLSLGWAQGTADLVGTYGGIHPDGINDFYMYASIGSVPEPSSALLAIAGIGAISLAAKLRKNGSSQKSKA